MLVLTFHSSIWSLLRIWHHKNRNEMIITNGNHHQSRNTYWIIYLNWLTKDFQQRQKKQNRKTFFCWCQWSNSAIPQRLNHRLMRKRMAETLLFNIFQLRTFRKTPRNVDCVCLLFLVLSIILLFFFSFLGQISYKRKKEKKSTSLLNASSRISLLDHLRFEFMKTMFNSKRESKRFFIEICLDERSNNILFAETAVSRIFHRWQPYADVLTIRFESTSQSNRTAGIWPCVHWRTAAAILSYVPALRHLNVSHLRGPTKNIPQIVTANLRSLSLDSCWTEFGQSEIFLTQFNAPLTAFSLENGPNDESYLDGARWKMLISEHFSLLTLLDLEFFQQIELDHGSLYFHDLNGFTSPFWTERNWACVYASQTTSTPSIKFVRTSNNRKIFLTHSSRIDFGHNGTIWNDDETTPNLFVCV